MNLARVVNLLTAISGAMKINSAVLLGAAFVSPAARAEHHAPVTIREVYDQEHQEGRSLRGGFTPVRSHVRDLQGLTKCVYDNGIYHRDFTGVSNGVASAIGAQRTVLDDFVVPAGGIQVQGIRWYHIWSFKDVGCPIPIGSYCEVDAVSPFLKISFRLDHDGAPDARGRPLAVPIVDYEETETEIVILDRTVQESTATFLYVYSFLPGTYWIEATIVGPEENFWLVRPSYRHPCGFPSWINYEDAGGLQPGFNWRGIDSELSFCLLGPDSTAPATCTKRPTKNPTELPTKNPTESPTKNPTESPTKNPTESPTKNPTESPTKNPTESPTKNPTESPTKNPTESPTKNPTESPTKNPTESPTNNPTGSPVEFCTTLEEDPCKSNKDCNWSNTNEECTTKTDGRGGNGGGPGEDPECGERDKPCCTGNKCNGNLECTGKKVKTCT